MDTRAVNHLSNLYRAYHAAGDMPDCIVLWGQLASTNYQPPPLNTALPSIISAFQPKSGSTFIFNRLIQSFGYTEYNWGITHPIDLATMYAVPESLERYLRGGCASHTHCRPSPYNISLFQRYQVRPVWVHLRHPAASTLSAYHHYLGEGQGHGEIAEARRRANREQARTLGLEVGNGRPNERDKFLLRHIEFAVTWILDWVRYAEKEPANVFFTYFSQLVDHTLFAQVADKFGIGSVPDIPAHLDNDRLRDGTPGNWRSGLAEQTVDQVETLLQARLGPSGILEKL